MCWFKRKRKKLPESVTVPALRPTTVVYVFSGWQTERMEFGLVPGSECPNRFPWKVLQTDDRHMALGEYDEADPSITLQRIRWMEEAGVDCLAYQVQWAHAHAHPSLLPSWRSPLPSPLLMKHCADNHPIESNIKWFFDNWDVMSTAGDRENYWSEMQSLGWNSVKMLESWRMYARTVASYMTRPSYMRIDNRPILMHGSAQGLAFYQIRFGINPAQIISIFREEIKAATGQNPYIIATNTDPEMIKFLRGWGVDAIADYLLHDHGWQATMNMYRYWWGRHLTECKTDTLDYWIAMTCGYDSAAWGSPVRDDTGKPYVHQPTATQFADHVREARKVASENVKCTRGFTILYALNENGEGGIFEPMAPNQLHDGDELLDAFRLATGR